MFRSGLLLRHDSSSSSETETGEAAGASPAAQQDTLLVYIYNEDDPVYRENFQHFLLAGVQPGSRCRYAFGAVEPMQHNNLGVAAAAFCPLASKQQQQPASCRTTCAHFPAQCD
jgi:hypothetical protein